MISHSRSPHHPALWRDGGMGFPALAGLALAQPKQPFGFGKQPGACFLGRKKPLRAWGHALSIFDTHRTLYPHQKQQFRLRNNPGACFLGQKKPLRAWGHALPSFGALFLGRKKPLRAWGHALPSLGGGPVSNPVPPGCDVRVPTH